jgi:hypothetical protein
MCALSCLLVAARCRHAIQLFLETNICSNKCLNRSQVEAKQAQVAEQNEIERRARMAQLQRDQAERKVSGGR